MIYNYITCLHTWCSYSYIRKNFIVCSQSYHHLFKITFFSLFLPTHRLHKWLPALAFVSQEMSSDSTCRYLAFRGPWLGSGFRVLLWHLTLVPTSSQSYELDILDWTFFCRVAWDERKSSKLLACSGPLAPGAKWQTWLPDPVHLVDFLQLSVEKLVAFNGRLLSLDSVFQWPQKGLKYPVMKCPRSHSLLLWPYGGQRENPSTLAWAAPPVKSHQQHL